MKLNPLMAKRDHWTNHEDSTEAAHTFYDQSENKLCKFDNLK